MKIYKHHYTDIDTISIVYENKKNYFWESQDGDNLFRIEKSKVLKSLNGQDFGYYNDSNVAQEAVKVYLNSRIKEYQKILNKI